MRAQFWVLGTELRIREVSSVSALCTRYSALPSLQAGTLHAVFLLPPLQVYAASELHFMQFGIRHVRLGGERGVNPLECGSESDRRKSLLNHSLAAVAESLLNHWPP